MELTKLLLNTEKSQQARIRTENLLIKLNYYASGCQPVKHEPMACFNSFKPDKRRNIDPSDYVIQF